MMTLMTDLEKMRRDMEMLQRQTEANTALAAQHEQQIHGDRGITDTLRQLSGEIQGVHTELSAFGKQLTAVEKAFGEWAAIAQALAEKGVSTRVFVLGVLGVMVPLLIILFSHKIG